MPFVAGSETCRGLSARLLIAIHIPVKTDFQYFMVEVLFD